MIIWNRKHLIGTSPKCARRSIVDWGANNGFAQLSDADVKNINDCDAVYLIRNPNGRLPKQVQTVTKRFATAHGKEPMAEWSNTEELMSETLADEPKDWYNINPVYLQTQKSASEKYKNINWKFVKLDDFDNWATNNNYNNFELYPENADPNLIALITLFLEESGVESLYKEDFDLYKQI